jgi:membrane protein required for colicin V production
MTIVDLIIVVLVFASVVLGAIRGFVREAISITALLFAVVAAMRFGPIAGGWLGGTLGSSELELWAGRILVFIAILAVGALAGWAVSKIVSLAGLSGTDRTLGAVFGFARAVVFVALFVLLGRYAAMDSESWWHESRLIPYGETVADWIEVIAPKGMELFESGEMLDQVWQRVPDTL